MKIQKHLSFKNKKSGIKQMGIVVNNFTNQGWVVVRREVVGKGFNKKKGCCFGFLFLPLLVLGIENGTIEVDLEKETDNVVS